nr:hypothetical protein [Tanacetum cinerariifolium]
MLKVLVVAYYEDGLSLIATQIGRPIMLDTFTSERCADPWGRLGFIRALIEVSADKELKQNVTMAIPNEDGMGHTKECIRLEYEWKPSLCLDCHVFGHTPQQCPKRDKVDDINIVKLKNNFDALCNNDDLLMNNIREASESKKDIPTSTEMDLSDDDSEVEELIMELDSLYEKGCRIILGWNMDVVDLMVISKSTQVIHGLHYTWNQKPKGGGVLKKLDRIMGNVEFCDVNQGAFAIFQPYKISNHALAVLKIPGLINNKPKLFKFYNFLTYKSNFLDMVEHSWNINVDGYKMFQNAEFLGSNVAEAFILHYESFLDSNMPCDTLDMDGLFQNKVSNMVNSHIIRPLTDLDIKATMFDIGDDKAPGPDGYTSAFFKKSWDSVGVPLISSRLLNRDCKVLVESAKNKIRDWKNKSLSFVGRLQLCKSVISSMHVYWASVLAIPKGGVFMGLMDSCAKVKGRSFWVIPLNDADKSWGWRKLLQLHDLVKPFIWTKIGNKNLASAWYDIWDPQCPLIYWFSPRDIARAGFHLNSCVANLISSGGWFWPQDWLRKAPNINTIIAPTLTTNIQDTNYWCDVNGKQYEFSVKCAWESLRMRRTDVVWFHVVWFPYFIPRHAFHLWLVMRNGLRTLDKLRQ